MRTADLSARLRRRALDEVFRGNRARLWRASSPHWKRDAAGAFAPEAAEAAQPRRQRAGARHHRNRRLGQVVAHRRADPPLPHRSGRRAQDRHDRRRSVAAQDRRRAAGRPHPHERDQSSEHLHALARHSRCRQRDRGLPAGSDRRLQVRRLRPDTGGDFRHRPGRRGHRPACGLLAVCDDARSSAPPASSRKSTCSTLPISSRSTSSTAAARRMRCATCASSMQRNRGASTQAAEAMPVFGTMAVALQRRRRDRALSGHRAEARRQTDSSRRRQASSRRQR